MRRLLSGLLAGVLVLGFAGSADAQPSAAEAKPTPATIGGATQFDFTSAVNGKTYRVAVAMPLAPPPKGGYPIVFVLDGGAYFGTVAGAARMRSALGGEVTAAVIVGIAYPSDDMTVAMRRRFRDLTPSMPAPGWDPGNAPGGPPSEFAGAEEFLKVIQTEVRPQVARMAPVAAGQDVLFGHSLGGLFVVHALFNHPDAFRTYLALSPSIWWSDKAVLKDEAAFLARVAAKTVTPRVYIGVGELEEVVPPGSPPSVATEMREARMVTNAVDLAQRLKALKGAPGYEVASKVFPGRTHVAAPWDSMNTLLDFALKP